MSYEYIPGWFSKEDVDTYNNLVRPIHNGVIVEIGVFAGRSSVSIGDLCKANHNVVYCVDHWQGSSEYFTGHPYFEVLQKTLNDAGWPNIYETFLKNVKSEGFEGVLIPMRMSSQEAATLLHDIDLVFIDAEHTFEAMTQDINAWIKNIKPGGIIAGHDYCQNWPGVIKAVDHCLGEVTLAGEIWYKKISP